MEIQIPNITAREALQSFSRIVASVPMTENDRLNAWGCQESLAAALTRLEEVEAELAKLKATAAMPPV